MAVHLPRYLILVIFSLSFLACNLFTRGLEDNLPQEQTPPLTISTQAGLPPPTLTQIPQTTPTLEPTKLPSPTATTVPVELPLTDATLMAFITAPKGTLTEPYVILTAYGATEEDPVKEIRGKLGLVDFSCPGSKCLLSVSFDNTLSISAQTQAGKTSEEVRATIRVNRFDNQFEVSIESLNPAVLFTDYCAGVWELGGVQSPNWSVFPQSPTELATDKVLHYLAGQLIASGVVNATDCPSGGFNQTGPNSCGLERTAEAMLIWQNQYDFNIWLAGREQEVPPILLKTLIERESQFWPMSQRFFLDEYGLTQVNELGIDVALRWDMDLYMNVCSQTLFDCPGSYYRLSPSNRAMLRGALVSLLYADCPTCPYGVNLTKAQDSVPLTALILRYNCNDTKHVLEKFDYLASYEDYWKFTMVAYHSGINCLDNALRNIVREGWQVTWSQIADEIKCTGAKEYVEQFWAELETFEENQIIANQGVVELAPVAPVATPTLVPTPTIALSSAKIRVQVFADINGNGLPEPPEMANDVEVLMQFADGNELSGRTVNGEVVFDLTGYPIGMGMTISLPSFYRTEQMTVPPDGETLVTFKFTGPPFPTALP
jgi:hypothetical protein